jgi:hypothetical protein
MKQREEQRRCLKIAFFAYPTSEPNHGLQYELCEVAYTVLQAGDTFRMQSRTRAGDSIPSARNNEVLFEMFCFLTAMKFSEILCKLHYCKNYTELVCDDM